MTGEYPGWTLDHEDRTVTDPLRPPDDYEPDPRVPASGWEHRRLAATDEERPGMVIVYASLAIMLAIILGGLLWMLAASRSGPDPTAPQPASDAVGLVQAFDPAPVSASGPSQSTAPLPAWIASSESGGGASVFEATRYAGTATWYCGTTVTCTRGYGPGDMIAAIDTDLGFHKGDRVTVRAFGRAVTVRIVDVCGCPGRRLIDLSRGAFSRLANPDYGVIAVTLELAGARPIPIAPATDR